MEYFCPCDQNMLLFGNAIEVHVYRCKVFWRSVKSVFVEKFDIKMNTGPGGFAKIHSIADYVKVTRDCRGGCHKIAWKMAKKHNSHRECGIHCLCNCHCEDHREKKRTCNCYCNGWRQHEWYRRSINPEFPCDCDECHCSRTWKMRDYGIKEIILPLPEIKLNIVRCAPGHSHKKNVLLCQCCV